MPSQDRNRHDRRAVIPSAPPLHEMPRDQRGELPAGWGPPPRYEEAIAEKDPSNERLPSPTYQNPNSPNSRLFSGDRHFPSSSNNLNGRRSRQTGSLTSIGHSTRETRRTDSRYRSASPGQMSEAIQDSGQVTPSSQENTKKKGSGYKIKKGLESLGWFIVQILD